MINDAPEKVQVYFSRPVQIKELYIAKLRNNI